LEGTRREEGLKRRGERILAEPGRRGKMRLASPVLLAG
jgi:hypothetical protein